MERSMLRRRDARDQQGQTLVLFVLLLTGMLMMSVLLFDAANALVIRRRIQNSADAAALAAANLIQVSPRGCNGGSGSTPRTLVANAATNSATANLSGLTVRSVTVTCLPGFGDVAVRVVIDATAPTFFGAIAGSTNVPVSAKGTAI
ncbi:MAG: pilus assembly protein TadG-related protein, partial [Candidatus Limnocylindrales bacterium]